MLVAGAAFAGAASVGPTSSTVTVAGDGTPNLATATCPTGEKLVSAGFATTTNNDVGVLVTGMFPLSSRKVRAEAVNLSDIPGVLKATAYCAKPPRRKSKKKAAPKLKRIVGTVANTTVLVTTVQARCPAGTSVRIGGFQAVGASDGRYAILKSMKLKSSRSVVVKALSPEATLVRNSARGLPVDPGFLSAIALCGKGPKLTAVTRSAPAGGGTATGVTARCPQGKSLAFGGFTDIDPLAGTYLSKLSRGGYRSATARVFSFTDSTPTSIAYCG